MARRGNSNRGQRDALDPSLAELLAPVRPLPELTFSQVLTDVGRSWTEVEDTRRFDPERSFRSPLAFSGGQASARSVRGSTARVVGPHIGFDQPQEVVRCARRKSRREVIFAKRKFRKGAGARRRRFNFWSLVRC